MYFFYCRHNIEMGLSCMYNIILKRKNKDGI
nr:MAG TPA: hypothetical protein [Caudoviricetes sp.]